MILLTTGTLLGRFRQSSHSVSMLINIGNQMGTSDTLAFCYD